MSRISHIDVPGGGIHGSMKRFHHDQHELNWTPTDDVTISVNGEPFHITPQTALWVPAGVKHRVGADPRDVIFPLRFEPVIELPTELREPTLIRVTPSLRGAILRVVQGHLSPRFSIEREKQQVLALLPPLAYPHVSLPVPDPNLAPRTHEIAKVILEDPAHPSTIEDWAVKFGVSSRTILREFVAQTGATYSTYRMRARLSRALTMLNGEHSIAEIALAVGYGNSSAFITAFKREFGRPPLSFMVDSGSWTEDQAAAEARAAATAAVLEQQTQQAYRERFGLPEPIGPNGEVETDEH